jgi:probable phosphoglycerate mutase
MPSDLPRLFLARHGDTAWTDSRQHTGSTDLALNEAGEARARQIGEKLRRYSFSSVFTSPLQRASKTCELAPPPSVGVLAFEHKSRDAPIIGLWNYVAQPRD